MSTEEIRIYVTEGNANMMASMSSTNPYVPAPSNTHIHNQMVQKRRLALPMNEFIDKLVVANERLRNHRCQNTIPMDSTIMLH